ncbi:hypothetical protein CRG98_032009 [Punica granatum]|uniref:Uncharacterized protein n=1 Tax=Punica granatum TaxID=22663 RepID=A0A2I0IVE2_PUNGR|nr:hypothetical protein CRG98_032009 [Punica granatum]
MSQPYKGNEPAKLRAKRARSTIQKQGLAAPISRVRPLGVLREEEEEEGRSWLLYLQQQSAKTLEGLWWLCAGTLRLGNRASEGVTALIIRASIIEANAAELSHCVRPRVGERASLFRQR